MYRHTVQESYLCVSFIGADTLPCSSEWDLMSEPQSVIRPRGSHSLEQKTEGNKKRGRRMAKNLRKWERGDEGGENDVELICYVLLCYVEEGKLVSLSLRHLLFKDQCPGLALPISPPLSTRLSSVSNNTYPKGPSFHSTVLSMWLCRRYSAKEKKKNPNSFLFRIYLLHLEPCLHRCKCCSNWECDETLWKQ